MRGVSDHGALFAPIVKKMSFGIGMYRHDAAGLIAGAIQKPDAGTKDLFTDKPLHERAHPAHDFQLQERDESMNLQSVFKDSENVQELQSGATVFGEGTHGDVMYTVLDGQLEISTGGRFVEMIGPGDLVGEMVLIDSNARNSTVVAKSDCRLAPVDKKRFLFMVRETPFFALHVMRVLADRL